MEQFNFSCTFDTTQIEININKNELNKYNYTKDRKKNEPILFHKICTSFIYLLLT